MSKSERKANLTIIQINRIFFCGVNHAFVSPRKFTSCKEDVPSENAVKATLRVTCWHQIDHHCNGGGGGGEAGARRGQGGWRGGEGDVAISRRHNRSPNNSPDYKSKAQ